MKIMTRLFFRNHPEAVWEWTRDFETILKECEPNAGHHAILRFQEHCATAPDKECMLVTQNIDNLHEALVKQSAILQKPEHRDRHFRKNLPLGDMPLAFTPHVYAIHGNVNFMHCSDEERKHSKDFKPCPVAAHPKQVPKCEQCSLEMKPHGMFFDEAYSEHYYRSLTVSDFYQQCDALIVVGTALETSMAKCMVESCCLRGVPVIEVNLRPCIDRGATVHRLSGQSEITLPLLFDSYYQ